MYEVCFHAIHALKFDSEKNCLVIWLKHIILFYLFIYLKSHSPCFNLSLCPSVHPPLFFFFKVEGRIIYLFIYLFTYLLTVLGLCFCARAFSSCGKRGPLFIMVCGPFTIAASLVAGHRLQGHRLQIHRLSSCGSRAQLLRGMWDLPRPGLEPMSPALAGRFSATAPRGKPHIIL